jgi:putative hydrolase of the HAD superfamily
MSKVEAIFLDLDKTLLDPSNYKNSIIGTCQVLADHQPALDVTKLIESNSTIWSEYWPTIEKKWISGEMDDLSVSRESWRLTLQNIGSIDEKLIELAVQTHTQLIPQTYQLYSDVDKFIAIINEKNIPLALITNGASEAQRSKLKKLKIENQFESIIISGEVGYAKPDPKIFDLAINKIKSSRKHTWHIGDNLLTDIKGAITAGINGVWINRKRKTFQNDSPVKPDYIISNLLAFISLLN